MKKVSHTLVFCQTQCNICHADARQDQQCVDGTCRNRRTHSGAVCLFFAARCAVAKFFGFWIFDDGTFPVALLAASFRALALLTVWWLSLRYLPTLAVRLFKVDIPPRETALLAAFGLLPVFVVYLILAFTSASFLYFLALYNYIILYGGVGVLLDTDERTRGRLAQMVAIWLWALPLAIEWLLRLLVPNAPL